jgi:hypothetical protein
MSNEVSVPEPLSGTEVIEAIVYKVREQLRRDCFLSPNSAYEYFSGRIRIEIQAIDCGRQADVQTEVNVSLGPLPGDNSDPVEETSSDEDIPADPPNVVRRETQQSVPVVTTDSSGKAEVKRVNYQRQSAAATDKPHGNRRPAAKKNGTPPTA